MSDEPRIWITGKDGSIRPVELTHGRVVLNGTEDVSVFYSTEPPTGFGVKVETYPRAAESDRQPVPLYLDLEQLQRENAARCDWLVNRLEEATAGKNPQIHRAIVALRFHLAHCRTEWGMQALIAKAADEAGLSREDLCTYLLLRGLGAALAESPVRYEVGALVYLDEGQKG